ncbi:MAG: hypothetical protein RBT62_12635 [Spirochaetia bacterium]|jgi:hypothetical protein|nr:hypothetical protein [Spirochaetia bacterium]
MNKRLLLVLSIAALSSLAATADDEGVYERWPSSLGYSINSSAGPGLSWQRWFGSYAVAITAGGVYAEAGTDSMLIGDYDAVKLDYALQLRLSRMLFTDEFSPWLSNNLQAVALLAHRGYIGMDYRYSEDDSFEAYYEEQAYATQLMLGVGVSAELTVFEHFSQCVDLLYVAKWPLELALTGAWSFRYRY